jgi:subtilase family serine protease
LTNTLRQLYQRGSAQFHHYLKPADFTAAFAPTAADYQALIAFAKSQGLTVTGTHPNRTLLDVTGSVANVERALRVHMNVYQHPTENRTFYAPDGDPAIDLATPILAIAGLHNKFTPHPHVEMPPASPTNKSRPFYGSAPDENYWGGDYRAAYVPGVSLDGTGQSVGLFELDGYEASDITSYENATGFAPVPLQNILIDGYSGYGTGDDSEAEVDLDIELAISMAPGLSNIFVYEGSSYSTTAQINDVLNRMATDNLAQQMSCSWSFDIDLATEQIFQQFAAQGQSFFLASGDSGAYSGVVEEPCDDPNITIVGGTALNTYSAGGPWESETAWQRSSSVETSGGISTVYPIPYWQQGVDMSANQGSTTMRNLPDVAMFAEGAYIFCKGGEQTALSGTSCAAPLWAGFTALVNQQAAFNGQPPVGFLNPALYAIGESTNYQACFHDITVGGNTTSASPSKFYAVPGYDLCTGWGSPAGSSLISALLAPVDALLITPHAGFTAAGPAGGPFYVDSENYALTNAGNAPLIWSVVNTSLWLSISPDGGTLAPSEATNVTIAVNSEATNSPIQSVTGTVVFTDLSDNVMQGMTFDLLSGNGGFETGDFSDWTLTGDPNSNLIVNSDDSQYGFYPLPGVDDSLFVHSGLCGGLFGQAGAIATLSQTVPTSPSQPYVLSFWLQCFAENGTAAPNEFFVQWGGDTLFDQTNMEASGWTNMEYIVRSSETNTLLEFGLRNDPAAFAMDDITLQPVPSPTFQNVMGNGNAVVLTFSTMPGLAYQVQFTTDLTGGNWVNLGPAQPAPGTISTATDFLPTDPRRFYRIVVLP